MKESVKNIAERLNGLRELNGYTIEEAANGIGITADEYKKYETAADDIPVSVVYEAAAFYEVDMTELLTGISPKLKDACFVKKGEGLSVERYDEYQFESLAYKYVKRKIEPLFVTLTLGKHPELVTHKGQEFNYMLEGKMLVNVGDQKFELSPGDSLYFNSMIPHNMIALEEGSKFLTVILL